MYATTDARSQAPVPGDTHREATQPAYRGEAAGEQPDLYTLMADYERRLILLALQAAGGHQRRAAASLGLLPSTLSEKLRRLGLRPKARTPRSGREHDAARTGGLNGLGSALT